MTGRQRSMAIRSGINKQGWESSDFPVACQKCYGENPFMRMLKQQYGQQCRLCFRPFTVFKWRGDKGFYKRTCVCSGCSKQKNICQFGLPMSVRDKRCGKNGKHLLDQNFTNSDSMKIKPPPPPGPPPPLKQHPSDKQLVYIPEKQSDEQGQEKNKQNQDKQIVAQPENEIQENQDIKVVQKQENKEEQLQQKEQVEKENKNQKLQQSIQKVQYNEDHDD